MNPTGNLDWENVKTVATVARAGTVRRAALELGVHYSTVSRRIENLEAAIGVRLFERRPEGYVLTEAGREIVAVAGSFSEKLRDVERQISGMDNMLTGEITVTMAEPIAISVFAPRLTEFCDMYPGLELEIIATYDSLDVSRREADVAIRMDNHPPENLVGKRLFPFYETVYACPDYLASRDLINDPASGRWLGWDRYDNGFPEWKRETEFADVPVWGQFAGPALQQAGARHGLGLAILPCAIGDYDPDLVRASKRPPQPAIDIWILTHSDLRRTARVRAFMEFAERVLRDRRNLFMGILDGVLAPE